MFRGQEYLLHNYTIMRTRIWIPVPMPQAGYPENACNPVPIGAKSRGWVGLVGLPLNWENLSYRFKEWPLLLQRNSLLRPSGSCTYTHTHTHTHTYTLTHIHIHSHIHTHTHSHTLTHIYSHSYTFTHHTPTHSHTHIHSHTRRHTHRCLVKYWLQHCDNSFAYNTFSLWHKTGPSQCFFHM